MTVATANHWLFQLASTCLLLSYSAKDVLFLRVVLMAAGIFFVLWGATSFDPVSIDTVLWNSIFTFINAYRAIEVAWSRRPIKFDHPQHYLIYQKVFGPVGIPRLEFKLMAEEGLLRKLQAGTTYIEAGNEASNLTLLVSGSMDIIAKPKDGRSPIQVGILKPMQFVESPQWANMEVQRSRLKRSKSAIKKQKSSVRRNLSSAASSFAVIRKGTTGDEESCSCTPQNNQDERSDEELGGCCDYEAIRIASIVEVTFRASTDIVFFTWPMERLLEFMHQHPNVSAPINAVIGADVASKLFNQAKVSGSGGGRSGSGSEDDSPIIQRRIYLPMDESATIDDELQTIWPLPKASNILSSSYYGGGDGDRGMTLLDESNNNKDVMKDRSYSAVVSSRMKSSSTTNSMIVEEADGDENEDQNIVNTPKSLVVDVATSVSLSNLEKTNNPLRAEQLWLHHRSLKDTEYDKCLSEMLRRRLNLNKYELAALLHIGRWRYILQKGTILIRQGEPVTFLAMLLEGQLSVHRENKMMKDDGASASRELLHSIQPGQLIGSIELHEPERQHIAGETIISVSPCTYIVWDSDDLRELLKPRPRLRAHLTTLIAADLSTKFRQVVEGGGTATVSTPSV